MLEINASAQFRRDRRLCVKRGYDMALLNAVVDTLCVPSPLPPENRDHTLTGNYTGHRECHIQADWLLIYRVTESALYLDRTGTHADLFRK
ncbi:MAG: type II toxin-antitoxin system YafQ family toxin [Oscillibacter sp.]|nr:type II toxin-antitoxin system YafQ family toxin [Oscillibacter sp.]